MFDFIVAPPALGFNLGGEVVYSIGSNKDFNMLKAFPGSVIRVRLRAFRSHLGSDRPEQSVFGRPRAIGSRSAHNARFARVRVLEAKAKEQGMGGFSDGDLMTPTLGQDDRHDEGLRGLSRR